MAATPKPVRKKIKQVESAHRKMSSRYVAKGYEEKEKPHLKKYGKEIRKKAVKERHQMY